MTRLMYRYWLDLENPHEHELANICEDLKRKREFAKTIRDGIRLVTSLKTGDLSVLFQLFPHLSQQLQPAKDDTAEKLNTVIHLLQSQKSTPMLASAISHQHIATPNNGLGFKSTNHSEVSLGDDFNFGIGDMKLDVSADTKSNQGNSSLNLIDALMAFC